MEATLSDKIESCDTMNECLSAESVKDFIKKLKEEMHKLIDEYEGLIEGKPILLLSVTEEKMINELIDKLAGDKLI